MCFFIIHRGASWVDGVLVLKRDRRITIRVTDEEKIGWEKAARKHGFSLSQYLRTGANVLANTMVGGIEPSLNTSDLAQEMEKHSEMLGKMQTQMSELAESLRNKQADFIIDENLAAEKIVQIILNPEFRGTFSECSTKDILVQEIMRIDPRLSPHLAPSPTRAVTALDMALADLADKGIVALGNYGESLKWNFKKRKGGESCGEEREGG